MFGMSTRLMSVNISKIYWFETKGDVWKKLLSVWSAGGILRR